MAQRRRPRDLSQAFRLVDEGEGAGSDDNGEGCSYSWEYGRNTDSNNEAVGPPNDEQACWCSSVGGSATKLQRRRRRQSQHKATSMSTSLALLASIPFLPLAQAVPFGETMASEKGKGKATTTAQDIDSYLYADTASSHDGSDRLGDILLKFNAYSEKAAHRISRTKRDGVGGEAAAPPPGLPGHYVYKDGQWVPSSDWSLNGIKGAPSSHNAQEEGIAGDDTGSSSSQAQIAIDTEADGTTLEADPDDLDEDSLGWAPTTKAMLGVDLEPSATISSASSSSTQSMIPTRTNMAQLSSTSSSASKVQSGTAATSSTSNSIVAYDFSHDVPNGWVNDGRTPAYAVPVIIGVSVVLAIIIFALVLIFVRGARRRKRRRKYGMKLQEEGDMPNTRPTSLSSQNQDDGDGEDMSRGARAPNGEIVYDEKKKQRIISRRWSLAGGQQSLRKRRGKIAKLLNRKGPIVEEVVPSSVTTAHQRTSSRQTSPLRRRTLSQLSRDASEMDTNDSASMDAERSHEVHSIPRSSSPSSSPMIRDASTLSSNTGEAQPSVSEDSTLLAANTASPASQIRPPILTLQQPTSSSLAPTHDSYNVPVPVVGPPAYIHPPSPAYTSNSVDSQQAGYFADEKRALLNHTPAQSGGHSIGASTSDPYRQRRRYEHLYTSRDGADAEREQRTGAPHAGPSSSGSAFRIQSEDDEEEEEGSQQPMRAHIAVDDKGLLNRIREAASSPSQPSSSAISETVPESVLDASAPPLCGLPEAEDEEGERGLQSQSTTSPRSFLPAPPRPVATSLSAIPPLLDEKARLRQAEEQQATYMLPIDQPSAPDFPSSSSADEPSVPDFDLPYEAGEASAPPLDEEVIQSSAPPLPDADDNDDDHHFSSRPHLEGIV